MIPQEEVDLAEILRKHDPKMFYNKSLIEARVICFEMRAKGWVFQKAPAALGCEPHEG